MKLLYSFLIVILFSSSIYCQTNNVFINIDHKIDNEKLVLNTGKYKTWNGVPYFLTRFQYYFTKITITHDGGQKTYATDVYLLVDPTTGSYSIGNYNIQNVESLEFYIGVDSKINHGDPTLWPPGHPLGPQNPDMNWGWAAGYRFAAIEGNSDSGNGLYSDIFQFHAIGDVLLTKVTVTATSTKDVNGDLVINLDADYNKLFSTIDLTGGKVVHGSDEPNPTVMSNFKEVFTASATTSTHTNNQSDFKVNYANPCIQPNIEYSGKLNDISFEIHNLNGQRVYNVEHMPESGVVPIKTSLTKGVYIISFTSANKYLFTNKLLIQD